MTLHVFTTHEKLNEIEKLIETAKCIATSSYVPLQILRAIAADLRARLDAAPSVTLLELDRRLAAAKRSKTALGYNSGALIGVGEEVIGRWPVIKQALEKFGAEVEEVEEEIVS